MPKQTLYHYATWTVSSNALCTLLNTFFWILYVTVTQYYSLLSVLRISSTWAVTNNSLKHVHVCYSLDITAVRQDIASAVWRAYSQLAYAARNPATAVAKAWKFPPFLAKFSTTTPNFLNVFGRAPSDLQLCFVQLKTLAPSARYSTFKYPVTLKPEFGITPGHRKL